MLSACFMFKKQELLADYYNPSYSLNPAKDFQDFRSILDDDTTKSRKTLSLIPCFNHKYNDFQISFEINEVPFCLFFRFDHKANMLDECENEINRYKSLAGEIIDFTENFYTSSRASSGREVFAFTKFIRKELVK